MYWAALSHSKEVLEVLCSLARTGTCNIDASIPDHSNSTPLDVAVASQQWDMVKLLLQSGGLKVCLHMPVTWRVTKLSNATTSVYKVQTYCR